MPKSDLVDDEFIRKLKLIPAYSFLDIDHELGKMDGWMLAHPGRRKTKRFVVDWLNRQKKPPETNDIVIPAFEEFWKKYPKQMMKGFARAAWVAINPCPDKVKRIFEGLERSKKSQQWTQEGGKWIPSPESYLKGEGWEDVHPRQIAGNRGVMIVNPVYRDVNGETPAFPDDTQNTGIIGRMADLLKGIGKSI